MSRTLKFIAALAIGLLSAAATLHAETFPTKPVHLIVGGGAGSFPDQVARRVADRLSAIWGQQVVVDNRPGKHVAMIELIKAAPDGYTLALGTMSHLVFNTHLMSHMPYDPQRDLSPVGMVLSSPMVVVAHPKFPAGSLAELLAAARLQPGALEFAVPGNGSPPHLVLAMLMDATGTSFYTVPFKTGSDAVVQVAGGQVPLFIDAASVVAPLIDAGRLKALAVTGAQRVTLFPGVPTVAEQGYPEFRGEAWVGLVARAGVPASIVNQINRDLAQALGAADLRRYFETLGGRIIVTSPEGFAALVRAESEHWGRVIRAIGFKLE
jgi:tripartite-type tricarboxylate transporter receptor subunit TctC